MAKTNYQFEKRRRDLEKKAKKEAKRLKKLEPGTPPADGTTGESPSPVPPTQA